MLWLFLPSSVYRREIRQKAAGATPLYLGRDWCRAVHANQQNTVLLQLTTGRGFGIDHVSTERVGHSEGGTAEIAVAIVEVILHVPGKGSVKELAAELSEVPS